MIYEVRNTFGEIHAYVLPVQPGEISQAGVRQEQDKLFYVSPFIGMAMRYRFRVSPPGARVTLRILETDREGPLLAATFQRPPPQPDHKRHYCARSWRCRSSPSRSSERSIGKPSDYGSRARA